MNFDKYDFIAFCKLFENKNEMEYDEELLLQTETGYTYSATFRDEANYKIDVDLHLIGQEISWSEPEYYGDEEETRDFFNAFIHSLYSRFASQNPLTRIFSPIV